METVISFTMFRHPEAQTPAAQPLPVLIQITGVFVALRSPESGAAQYQAEDQQLQKHLIM